MPIFDIPISAVAAMAISALAWAASRLTITSLSTLENDVELILHVVHGSRDLTVTSV
jgi:hypothetical protein